MQTSPLPAPIAAAPSAPRRGAVSRRRVAALVASAIAAAAYTFSRGRYPQPPEYLRFADDRTLLGIPNCLNVLSNLPFAWIGLAAIRSLRRGKVALRDAREGPPWLAFFVGVALTSVGSAWFHATPSFGTLVWDRLPMTIAFMALFAALVAERVDAAAGLRLLWPAIAAGLASVLYWYLSERAGAGDLRPYLLVQFYPLLAVPFLLAVFPRGYDGGAAYLVALGLYVLAKLAELADERILAVGGVVSGHTLKHLLSAAAIWAVAWMLARRRALA